MEAVMKERLLQAAENEENLKRRIWNESKKLWIIALPAILIRFSTFGINVVTQAFVGQIGATELAALALVFSVLLRSSNGILIGMNSGFGTLHGQAYGAKQYQNLGIYLQQGWIVLPTVAAMLCPLLIFAAPILKLLGQDELIVETTGIIALWFIPLMFSFAILIATNMFLQSQSKNMVLACFTTLSLLVHIFLSWLLVVRFEFGISGALFSTALAFCIPNVGQIAYIVCGGCPETWRGFTMLAFKDLDHTIKICASSCLMFSLEFWYSAILFLLAGNMENAEVSVDALTICLNISGLAQMITLGFMAATRAELAYVFTNSEDVADEVARLSPLLAYTLLLNSIQQTLAGVVAGLGRQGTVSYVNLASYYLIGIPLAVILGFVLNFQVQGVWMGTIIGSTVQTAILVIMICTTNWDNEISLAHKRINRPRQN